MLEIIYKNIKNNLPSFIKLRLSIEKAENVVKPPQNPTPTKRYNLFNNKLFSLANDVINNPNKKQPIILTRKVPNGKKNIFFSNIFPIPYLKIVPINPPKPIKMIFFIFLI